MAARVVRQHARDSLMGLILALIMMIASFILGFGRSLEYIYKDCLIKGVPVGLLAWNAWVEHCPVTIINEVHPEVDEWISDLVAEGYTDMRYALEEALRTYPQASDIYVICDGDISPFCLEGGKVPKEEVPRPASAECHAVKQPYFNTNFVAFRKRYPKQRFHFVALGDDADSKSLQQMAVIGGGNFLQDL